ncbi:MAG: DUF4430 domain-containing protein [Clostridia bacterium]|nr:DUF4430 domain-containing protein [Clostridia bacterium]
MKKDVIIFLLIIMLCAVFVLTTDFKTVDEYYLENAENIKEGDATVFISIRCDTVFDNAEKLAPALWEFVPEDGVILAETEYVLRDGDTVFDILTRAAKTRRIQMEYSGSAESRTVYIEGISHLYEFSCGELSGWSYLVNGEIPQLGASSYTLSDGDVIEWVYTCDLSRDILQGGVANE